MRVVYANKIYISVNTAVEGEVSHLGINGLVDGIFNENCDLAAVLQLFCNVYSPCRVAAVVVSELFAVYEKISGGIGSSELDVVKVSGGKGSDVESLCVKTRAAEIIVSAVVAVLGIPCVRKVYCNAILASNVGRVFNEEPSAVKIYNVSHLYSP